MASVNKVFILGTLGKDPDVRNGKITIANLSLATNRKYKASDGTIAEETEWHRVSLFGRSAEIAGQYLGKGDSVHIEGRLRTRSYTDKDGIERYVTEIVGERLTLLPNGRRNSGNGGRPHNASKLTADYLPEEDIPF